MNIIVNGMSGEFLCLQNTSATFVVIIDVFVSRYDQQKWRERDDSPAKWNRRQPVVDEWKEQENVKVDVVERERDKHGEIFGTHVLKCRLIGERLFQTMFIMSCYNILFTW